MKNILISIAILISVNSFAQVDTTKIKTSLSLQARDWLFLNSFIKNTKEFENVYDSFKVKLRAGVKPTLTTVIKVDSIKQGQILNLASKVKELQYSIISFAYNRLNTAFKSNAYLTRKIDELDANYSDQYDARLQAEYDDLRSVLIP